MNPRFSAWLNMFDGSVGAAWRGDVLGGGSGNDGGLSPPSSIYDPMGSAERGEGERGIGDETVAGASASASTGAGTATATATATAGTTKGGAGEMRRDDSAATPGGMTSRGNVGMVSNGSSSGSSSSSSSSSSGISRLRSRG